MMRKIAVVYWSGTGNTEAMAGAVADGIKEKGGEAVVLTAGEFDPSMIASFDGFAFGCPSMGAEQLEDSEFEPMFDACKSSLAGKPVALFGPYGWGDGRIPSAIPSAAWRSFAVACSRTLHFRTRSGCSSAIPPEMWTALSGSRRAARTIRRHLEGLR